MDIVRAAFASQGIDIVLDVVPYARCITLTKQGTYLACFNSPWTAPIHNDFVWPEQPMYTTVSNIYARKNNGAPAISRIRDLEGKRVAVVREYEYDSEFDANANIVREVLPNDISGLKMLDAGRVDYAAVFDKAAGYLFGKQAELANRFVIAGKLTPVDVYLAFSKVHPDTAKYLPIFNKGFAAIQKSGELKAIENRWK